MAARSGSTTTTVNLSLFAAVVVTLVLVVKLGSLRLEMYRLQGSLLLDFHVASGMSSEVLHLVACLNLISWAPRLLQLSPMLSSFLQKGGGHTQGDCASGALDICGSYSRKPWAGQLFASFVEKFVSAAAFVHSFHVCDCCSRRSVCALSKLWSRRSFSIGVFVSDRGLAALGQTVSFENPSSSGAGR